MRAVVTRVASASVQVDGVTVGAIERGLSHPTGMGRAPGMGRPSVRRWPIRFWACGFLKMRRGR